jgi:uncharacterized protein (UPF0332 family)
LAFAGEKNPSEITLRNAGSRAYYGLYHKTKSLIDQNNVTIVKIDSAGSHEGLIATVANQGIKGKSFAESMSKLKRFRHNCDYDLTMNISEKRLAVQLAEASRLISMVDRLDFKKTQV